MKLGDLKRLKALLNHSVNAGHGDQADAFNEICRLLFSDDLYLTLWDEEILGQSRRLFEVRLPNPKVFGKQLDVLSRRTELVRKVNDLYFCFLDNAYTVAEITERLSILAGSVLNVNVDDARIEQIRASRSSVSDKLEAFNAYVSTTLGLKLSDETEDALAQIVASSRMQEAVGKVKALLADRTHGYGVVVPLSVKLTAGKGSTQCLVPSDDAFKTAVERARKSAIDRAFLADSVDVTFSMETTSAEYSGNSIGLAAVSAIYSASVGVTIDQYTAFTGDVDLNGSDYRIVGVDAINPKLVAALRCGCRRVFIPKDNETDVDPDLLQHLRIEYVDDIAALIVKLLPAIQTIQGDTIHTKKMNFLAAHCRDKGWALSEPKTIKDGVQFTISSAYPPELKLNLYLTGSHHPKTSDRTDFQDLLAGLQAFDRPELVIEPINRTFMVKDDQLKAQLKDQFLKFNPKTLSEQYCDYAFRFQVGEENIVVKQYSNGKLVFQGRGGALRKRLLDVFISLHNLRYPNAHLSVDNCVTHHGPEVSPAEQRALLQDQQIDFPYIGTDESGKGDYFGSLVVTGVWVDKATSEKLALLGVRDSKLLSDKRCRELAGKIREICIGRFEEIELLPERYNELYDQFRKEGKNLNHLVAWGHARAIETILSKVPCPRAVADQFGDEKYILSKLMEKGKKVQLIQTPKAERYTAVATASILARDRFLMRMDKLGQKYQTILPRGASDSVIAAAKLIVQSRGVSELRTVAKLHHRTTQKVVGDEP